MPAIAPPLAIPPRGPAHPWPVEPLRLDPGRPGRTGQDPAAGRRGPVQHRHRRTGRLLAPDGHLVAAALHRGWPGRAGRSAPLGPASDRPPRPPRRDPGRHAHPTTRAPWGHPLVDPAAGRRARRQSQHRRRVWAEHDLKPWRIETFKFSTDPQLEAKVRDVVGLYLDPPERAIVVCVDEKAQIQALSRTAPTLPLGPGSPERRTHDYVRHGTTTLFTALEVATGRVVD
jgi:hypothetical protein